MFMVRGRKRERKTNLKVIEEITLLDALKNDAQVFGFFHHGSDEFHNVGMRESSAFPIIKREGKKMSENQTSTQRKKKKKRKKKKHKPQDIDFDLETLLVMIKILFDHDLFVFVLFFMVDSMDRKSQTFALRSFDQIEGKRKQTKPLKTAPVAPLAIFSPIVSSENLMLCTFEVSIEMWALLESVSERQRDQEREKKTSIIESKHLMTNERKKKKQTVIVCHGIEFKNVAFA